MKKNIVFASAAAFVMMGCTSVQPPAESMSNHITIGTKEGAHSVIELTYHNTEAEPEFQNYTVSLYLSQLPDKNEFKICDFEYDKCNSAFSAWENALRPEQNGIWFSYDLAFPMDFKKEHGINLSTIQHLGSQSLLKWDKQENLYEKNFYVDNKLAKQSSMSAIARKLP